MKSRRCITILLLITTISCSGPLFSAEIKDVSNGEPIQSFALVQVIDGNIIGNNTIFVVPPKKVLIIEQVEVSSFGFTPTNQKMLAGISTSVAETTIGHDIGLLEPTLSDQEQHLFRRVRIYADPDTSVDAYFNRRPTTGGGTYMLRFVITGYLVDAK